MPKTLERRNNALDNNNNGKNSILLDELNLKIMKDMMDDANVENKSLAKRHKSPLSTIQRRRTKLERTILEKR